MIWKGNGNAKLYAHTFETVAWWSQINKMNHKAMKCSTHAELNVPSPHMTLCPIISIILTYVENKKYAKYDNNQY